MSTSELSDALNPYVTQNRRSSNFIEFSPAIASSSQPLIQPTIQPIQPAVQPLQPVVPVQPLPQPQNLQLPHWQFSELQNAVVQAEPLPSPPAIRQQQPTPSRMLAELVRIVAATQNAQEAENKRRMLWEQEQEVKAAQKQADMDKKMLEFQNEIMSLRSELNTLSNSPSASAPASSTALLTPQFTPSVAFMPQLDTDRPVNSPISPVSQPSPQQPMFVQGSSNDGLRSTTTDYAHTRSTSSIRSLQTSPPPQSQDSTQPGLQSITPDPSPQLAFSQASVPSPQPSSRPSKRGRRRRSPSVSSDASASDSASSFASSIQDRPRKRISHHDTRCYTINHAMRLHVLRMMCIETDKRLPDSHTEGTSLGPAEPVRFVWDKTTKQSVHNSRMKTRVLEDIAENKRLYKHVNRKEFGKKSLDNAFEACFTTLRQKFKSQRDDRVAEHHKKREDCKARRSRHLSRRKVKLSNRAEVRNKLPTFEHVTFDGALQLDCMSSEESDRETDPQSMESHTVLTTHGYGWRSTRLLRFYSILDEEDVVESSSKPKRGSGRKERRTGPVKDDFILPPSGVASWMISRRWYKASLRVHQDLHQTLSKLTVDPPGFDWARFHDLGAESPDEEGAASNSFNNMQEHSQQEAQQLLQHQHLQLGQWQDIQQFPPHASQNYSLGDAQHQWNVQTHVPDYTF